MDPTALADPAVALASSALQIAVTGALAVLCALLAGRYRKPYFGLWALAWGLYAVRLLAGVAHARSGAVAWLYAHQVATGWAALALLWAALVFARRLAWRPGYATLVALPPAWALLVFTPYAGAAWAGFPLQALLAGTTGVTSWAFHRYDRQVGSAAGRALAVVFALWALHHLAGPLLVARGPWGPWGPALDTLFAMGMGLGIVFLVLEDLDQGLWTLTALSGELQPRDGDGGSVTEAVLRRALGLRGVQGSALYLRAGGAGAFVEGAGVAALWPYEDPPASVLELAELVCRGGRPGMRTDPGGVPDGAGWVHAYTAGLPVARGDDVVGALVVVGVARDPFTVLDDRFLVAFGQQVGAALENEDLHANLRARTDELERLQARMVHQHEEERNRLSRELHDETAQVLAALNLQLGVLAERGDGSIAPALERARELVAGGIRSIRSVTRNLRPAALDDLGLVPALRALVRDFEGQNTMSVTFHAPAQLPKLTPTAELALYRTMQEALANAVRHGGGRRAEAVMTVAADGVALSVTDDGRGLGDRTEKDLRSRGGLAGIRERIAALGGDFAVSNADGGGACVRVRVPGAGDEAM